jgi:hypothetical protein
MEFWIAPFFESYCLKVTFKHWKTVYFSSYIDLIQSAVAATGIPLYVRRGWGTKEALGPKQLWMWLKGGYLAEEMTRRKLFCVSGTMWNSKIRKTVANLSIKAGNMIHLFPFMQTQVYEGLCENCFSLGEPQRHRIKLLLLDILSFLSVFSFLWILWQITQQV